MTTGEVFAFSEVTGAPHPPELVVGGVELTVGCLPHPLPLEEAVLMLASFLQPLWVSVAVVLLLAVPFQFLESVDSVVV